VIHPTAERVRELLDYNPETGIFTWKVFRAGKAVAGSVAGKINSHGYREIRVDGARIGAHRLAFLYVLGRLPKKQVDHKNGIRDDNRMENLREASTAENMQNLRKANADNKSSGLLGASWYGLTKKWQARIRVEGKQIHIGYFDTAEEAHAAYLKAKAELHPFQTIVESAP
jgi:hypothetical protein